MSILLCFDTETTGLPSSKLALTDPAQPHLVSLAALQMDESGKRVQSMNKLIAPRGWEWADDSPAAQVHKLSAAYCAEHGRDEKQVLEEFLDLWGGSAHLIAHNLAFDTAIIKIAIARYYPNDSALLTAWESAIGTCTMLANKQRVAARNVKGALKTPNLKETYSYFMGEELEQHHTAGADAVAVWEIFCAMQREK
jgi:DNA polymerase III subunit epsilon